MAYEKRLLNPQAPEYVPLLHKTTHPSPLHFPRYPPPPYFAASATTAQPPFYAATSFHPTPPQAVVAARERSSSSCTTTITAWRPKISTSRSFGGGHAKGAEASGSGPHHRRQKVGNWALGPPRRACSNKVGNGGAGGEGQAVLKKHGVLPLRHSEEKTTVMIKNIPKQYNQELLLKFLDKHCMLENQKNKAANDDDVSAFDFMYLPIDFRTGGCKGYAFVNFTSPVAVWKFYNACNWKTWDLFQSPKIREIVCALIQGKEALVNHFERSLFWCESDEFLPVCFSPARDGSGESVEENRVGRRIPKRTKAPNPIR